MNTGISYPLLAEHELPVSLSEMIQVAKRDFTYNEAVKFTDWQDMESKKYTPYTTYWLKISFTESTAKATKGYLLDLGRNIDYATLYLPDGTKLKSGRLVPEREKVSLFYYWEVFFQFSYQPKSGDVFYLRIEERSGLPPQVTPILSDYVDWKAEREVELKVRYLLQGVFQGALWIMIIYSLAIFFTYLDRVYLHYALYMLGASLFTAQAYGILDEFFISNSPELSIYLRSIGIHISAIFYFVFMNSFLDTKTNYPKVYRAVIWLQRVLCLNLVVVTGALLFTNNVYLYRLETILVFGVVYLLSFGIIIYLLITKERNTLLVYFLLALASLMISGCIAVAVYFLASDKVNLGVFVEIGVIMEIIFFSLGLGYRMKAREQERRELELQNAALLKEQNAALEKRVEERTRELSKSKEEIQTQNEELRQQQEEVLAQRSHIEEQNNTLRERETRINDSLRYAQTIQKAILLVEETLRQASSDYFMMYHPKDIVSGDFYWVEKEGKYYYWAVADCTGHGVPGAFMSMMGATLLNDTVHEIQGAEPAQILEELDLRLRHALSQRTSKNKDGMDIALCRLEKKPNNEIEIIFAGAKRPLYFVNPAEPTKGVQKIRGTRRSIGGRLKRKRSFEQVRLTLPKGSTLYLFSDGYSDQHDKKGKKIGSVRFHALLEEIMELPLATQAERIETYFATHKKEQIQRDDVTVLGIQL